MIGSKALMMAVAAVVLIGGIAAVGAAAPADQASDNATDAYEENAPDNATDTVEEDASDNATDASEDASDDVVHDAGDANARADRVGPSGGLPEQAPDHVSEIHETIQSHLDGSIENLGQALSDLLGGDAGASASAEA
jgi:hypothetical protein